MPVELVALRLLAMPGTVLQGALACGYVDRALLGSSIGLSSAVLDGVLSS